MKDAYYKAGKSIPYLRKFVQAYEAAEKNIGILQLEKGQLEAEVRERQELLDDFRALIARQYISGHGIEIGPSYLPVKLPKQAKVKYVDVLPATELKKLYRDIRGFDLVEIDVIDNGEKLAKFRATSLDFIIANHFLEHCIDPIGTIMTMYQKLKKNGALYLAIPDKRQTFDRKRTITPYQHLLDEHFKPSEEMRFEHYIDVVGATRPKFDKDQVKKLAQELYDQDFSIHYHVWDTAAMYDMFRQTFRQFKINLEIVAMAENQHETIFVIKKIAK